MDDWNPTNIKYIKTRLQFITQFSCYPLLTLEQQWKEIRQFIQLIDVFARATQKHYIVVPVPYCSTFPTLVNSFF
jgi:hypothetical protein